MRGLCPILWEVSSYTVFAHEILEVEKSVIHLLVSVVLDFVYIIKFIKDYIECFFQCKEVYGLLIIPVPYAPHAEIGVYEQ